jgi:molybdate transport system substrate-binding protein
VKRGIVAALALQAALAATALAAAPARGGEVHVAVATSFVRTARELADAFRARTGHQVVLSEGSTGKLYAQIANGAPFEVFLSADAERPRRLVEEGHGVAGTRFPYALGQLVLWSRDPERVPDASALRGDFRHLAIANPELAPYGAAARETLQELGLWEALQDRIVRGEDVGQAYQFVASGNAELGFVALSQLAAGAAGSRWQVPAGHHAPLEQHAVLLAPGRDDDAARAFLAFLQGAPARERIQAAGYGLPPAASP